MTTAAAMTLSAAARACAATMRAAGVSEQCIHRFLRQHAIVSDAAAAAAAAAAAHTSSATRAAHGSGDGVYVREADVCPLDPDELPTLSSLAQPPRALQRGLLAQTVVLKLAGGLGTTMGMPQDVPKALLCARAAHTFLDVALAQMRCAHATYHALADDAVSKTMAQRHSSRDGGNGTDKAHTALSPLRFVWLASTGTAASYRRHLHARHLHWPELHCCGGSVARPPQQQQQEEEDNNNVICLDDDDETQDLPAYMQLVQHAVVKIACDTLAPVSWPRDRRCEWAPAGHGDVYHALHTSGLLRALRRRGYRYVFISNADNLAATLELRVLAHMHTHALPFVMEVCRRTWHDRVKGGHVAKLWPVDGNTQQTTTSRLVLRETAQCHPDDAVCFADTTRHVYFNTNNLYVSLDALQSTLPPPSSSLLLPVLRNAKTVDATDATSTPVYQLESAAGAAVSLFARATAVVVPRSRFVPVKSCADLLAVRSDLYTLSPGCGTDAAAASSSTMAGDATARDGVASCACGGALVLSPQRAQALLLLHGQSAPSAAALPVIDLDARYYAHVDGLRRLLARGVPSLVACTRLSIRGPVVLGARTVIRGCVHIECTTANEAKEGNVQQRQQEQASWAVLEDDLVLDNTTYTVRAPCT